ncbi:MAG: lipid-binding SYLF domain-containing protein [Acidobacteriaceae bacterium]
MKKFLALVALFLTLPAIGFAKEDSKSTLNQRLNSATQIIHALMAMPGKNIPLDVAGKTQCVIVVPSFKKAAFVLGAQYGQGVASCRTPKGWSAPAFIQLEGASVGFQIGGQSTDLVLLGVSHHSLDDLLQDKLKLGADASVAAGPVGRNAQASTTELANADFLTYSRSKGLFAGIDLSGDVVHQNSDDTRSFYGKNIPFNVILRGGVPTPASAAHFVATVNQLFRAGKAQDAR